MKPPFLLLILSSLSPIGSTYKKLANKQCPEADYSKFLDKSEAILKCNADSNCFAIYDPGCGGQNYLICENEARWEKNRGGQESQESCIYMKPRAWMPSSLTQGIICPSDVVSGSFWSYDPRRNGTCAMTWYESSNKLMSYNCDQLIPAHSYICQKGQ